MVSMTDFNPILFYDLASELYKNITPDQQDKFMQATARTIISRAYYSAFLIARDQAGCTTQESPHSAVIGYFNKNKNQQYRKIANKLKDLRIRRNQSDYDLT